MASKSHKFRVVVQTDPPDAKSATEEARYGQLADLLLRPGASRDENRPTTRAHEDHERLKQEVLEVVDDIFRTHEASKLTLR
jgi:hypothetical protein